MDAQLDITKTIWITERQLGTIHFLRHRGNKIQYRLPPEIENSITLRFKGHGKTKNNQTGNLMLNVRVDRGLDQHGALWISETDAHKGCLKKFGCQRGFWRRIKQVQITVPILSSGGKVVRVRSWGQKSKYRLGLSLFNRPKGDLIVKLHIFPDSLKAYYRQVDALKTEDLALEGWVYRQKDVILKALGNTVRQPPVSASDMADSFNSGGWRAIAEFLVGYLGVHRFAIKFYAERDLPMPGQYQKRIRILNGIKSIDGFLIKIRSEFIDDPFTVTAILAHELCHIVEDQYLSQRGAELMHEEGQALIELERRVDLLMFIYQLGEFQLRVARQSSKTFGYFNQEIFERMYVILQRNKKTH